jgi:anaerobic selenocysteine-containing dehydrogenase
MTTTTIHKTCNLCEATCGLLIEVDGGCVRSIRPDREDPFSRGHICPKAYTLGEVQKDPDRLKFPVRRTRGGAWERISWEDALSETAERLAAIQRRDGRDAVATYLGNPSAHSFGTALYMLPLFRAIGSKNRYTASSVDTNPRLAASLLLYGSVASVAVPDLDRTQFLLVLGANPVVSNGSLMTAPGAKRRLEAIRARGGRLVVVDPRRTETAGIADEHIAIRPGRDALLLAALVHTILEEKIGRDGPATPRLDGLAALRERLAPLSPEAVAPALGLEAARLRRLAREFAAAPAAACYARIGTCLAEFGTLASWLVDVLNIVSGNLDRPGGSMFTTPAVDIVAIAGLLRQHGGMGRWRSRVRGAPEFNEELPASCMAEEMLTPGEGRVRGLLTIMGNPVLSTPNGRRLDRALAALEFFAAIDIYVNETTRHAHVILPTTWSLEHDNYEVLLHLLAVRNTAKYSPVVIPPEPGMKHDWEVLSELALRIAEARQRSALARAVLRLARRRRLLPGPRALLDFFLRMGPHGDRYNPFSSGLNLRKLERSPKGVDLGPLVPSLHRVVKTPGGRIDLAEPRMAAELSRLAGRAREWAQAAEGLVLIGRRDLRTNNSWSHNAPSLVKDGVRCDLLMHPDDAARRGLEDGCLVRIASRVGEVCAPLRVTDEMMPGVVSLPHGWGHGREGVRLRVAAAHPGVSVNDVTDDALLESVTGSSVVNGVPVEVERAGAAGAETMEAREQPSRAPVAIEPAG